jgi:Putative prokaryotic signal transducing protein
MITVAQFSRLQDALVLRMALESAGIAAFIPDENMASLAPPYLFVGTGIRLQVTEDDLAAAQAIMADMRKDSAP